MSDSISIDQLDDERENKHDFRRRSGAPMVIDPANPDKWLVYRRPSGYGKVLDDENALVNWKIDTAVRGVASSEGLAAQWTAVKWEDKQARGVLREKAIQAGKGNESADKGTALHSMTERVEDPNDDFEPPEQYAADIAAYLACLDEYGLVSEMVEVQMVNDAYRAAGTADRIYRTTKPLVDPNGVPIPVGALILGDLKTGQKIELGLPGYCIQMAIYADGVLYDVERNVRLPTPAIYPHWTLLVHLPAGQGECTLHWLSIDLGLKGALLAYEVKDWQNNWKNGEHDSYIVEAPSWVPGMENLPKPPLGDPPPVDLVAVFDAMVDNATKNMTAQLQEGFYGKSAAVEAEVVASSPEGDSTYIMIDRSPDGSMSVEEVVTEMVGYINQRLAVIREHPQAKEAIQYRWPTGVPTPKKGLSKPNHVVQVLNLLDKLEAEYNIPFGATDPRVGMQAGKRGGEVVRNETLLTAPAPVVDQQVLIGEPDPERAAADAERARQQATQTKKQPRKRASKS